MTSRAGLAQRDIPVAGVRKDDRHLYRWIVLLVVWTGFLISCVDRFAWASIAAPVGHALGFSVALLGSFTTAFYVGYAVSCPIGGIITDTFGSRVTLTFALVPLGLFTLGFSFIHSFYAGVALHLLMGLAAGAEYGASIKILSIWFGRNKGQAIGIWITGTSLAVVLANASIPFITQHYSWQAAYQTFGILTIVLAAVSFATLKDTPDNHRTIRITRIQIGQLLRSRNIILIGMSGFGAFYGAIGFLAWGNALMTLGDGLSPIMSGAVIVWFGVGAAISKPLFGWIYDRWPDRAKMLTTLVLLAFAGLLMVFASCNTISSLFVVAPLLGAAAYGYTPMLVGMYTRAAGIPLTGAAAGFVNTLWTIGSFISPIIIGSIYGGTHSLNLSLAAIAAGPIAGAIFLYFVDERKPAVAYATQA